MGDWIRPENELLHHVSGDFEEAMHHLSMADRPEVVQPAAGPPQPGAVAGSRGWQPRVITGTSSPVRSGLRARRHLRIV